MLYYYPTPSSGHAPFTRIAAVQLLRIRRVVAVTEEPALHIPVSTLRSVEKRLILLARQIDQSKGNLLFMLS